MNPRRVAAFTAAFITVASATLIPGAAQAAEASLPATRISAITSTAYDVNDEGTVAGYVGSWPNTRAVTWRDDAISYLELPDDATGSIAVAINGRGQVAGQINFADGRQEAAVWDSGGVLSSLGLPPGSFFTAAQDINDDGWVVGVAGSTGGPRGFVWDGSGPIELLPLPNGYTTSVAQGINNHGAIAGTASAMFQPDLAIVWQDGVITLLPPLADGATASAVDINDAGQVVGQSSTTAPPWSVRTAVLWDEGKALQLGSLGGSFGLATAINASGQIAGYSANAANEYHGVLWAEEAMTLLDPLPADAVSFGFGMNGSGTIVGVSAETPSSDGHAVTWSSGRDTTPPDLGVSVSPNLLWPPNHKYVTVHAAVTASDDSGAEPTVELVSITSSEPDNGADDGNTINDIATTTDPYTFQLRAERAEHGAGRVYTVTYRATDGSGNSATQSATVTVPVTR